jgi:protocatechuate 3,4-dioxygenase beta subunit
VRNRVAVAVGVVVLLVAALISWRTCGSGKHGSSSTSASSTASGASGSGVRPRASKPRGPVKPATLAGRVLKKSDGTGIPGAVVSITRAELINQLISSAEHSLIVVTDAKGAWTFTPVLPGTYFVAATASGFVPSSRAKFLVDSGDNQTGLDITLDTGGIALTGTVSDVLGGPIADARITVKREWDFELSGSPELITMTKADGTYQIQLAEGDYEVHASHDDYTSSQANVEILQQPAKRDFVLTPGAVVRGQVVARDSGKPVPGAFIVAGVEGSGGDKAIRGDEDGNFVLRGLRPGALSIRAQGPGYASVTPTIVEIAIGEQVDGVRVLVERAFTISGNVVRKGKPDQGVPGVQLGMFSIATQQYGVALEPTDENGAFVIHGVRPASYMLLAGGEGNVPEVGKAIDVVDKDVTDVLIEMSTGVTLAGRVEPPVAGARVTLKLTGGIGIAQLFDMAKSALVHGDTDETGAFTVRNAPSGAFTLVAAAKSGDTGELPLVIGEVDQQGLVVKLETRASISGRVVDDKGAPVTEATISARNIGEKQDVSFSFGNDRKSGTLRADGSFKLVGLEAGKYSLSLRDTSTYDALKIKDGKAPKYELAKGQQLANVVVTVEARDGVIRGVVIGSNKKPIADAWVTAERPRPDWKNMKKEDMTEEKMEAMSDWSAPSKPVLTGADGRFVIERLRRGTYKLVAVGPRGASRGEVGDIKTGTSATITLLSLGTLTGKVTVDGAPVTAYDIECDGPEDVDSKSITDATGAYRIERLAPGSYECSVTADAGTGKAKVDVPPGDAKLDIALARWGVITGKVVDVLQKKPVAGVLVVAGSGQAGFGSAKGFEDMMRGRTPKSGPDGVFTLPRVPAGTGTVTFMGSELSFGDALATKPYTVKSGERIDLGTIEVVPPRQGDAGTFGFGTTIDDQSRLVVSSVKEGGPAAAVGVKEGDIITALSGIPVATLTPVIAQKLVSSGVVGVGVPVQLSLDRAGSPVVVSLVSVKW